MKMGNWILIIGGILLIAEGIFFLNLKDYKIEKLDKKIVLRADIRKPTKDGLMIIGADVLVADYNLEPLLEHKDWTVNFAENKKKYHSDFYVYEEPLDDYQVELITRFMTRGIKLEDVSKTMGTATFNDGDGSVWTYTPAPKKDAK